MASARPSLSLLVGALHGMREHLVAALACGGLGVCAWACMLWSRSLRLERERLYVTTFVNIAEIATGSRRHRRAIRP